MQRVLFLSAALVSAAAIAYAQEQADPRTLIPSVTLNAIAQHVSGAQARNHVLEMCPYERNRPAEEYQLTYREAAYAEAKAKEYGFSDVRRDLEKAGAYTIREKK
jgi:hypothetical protein